MDPTSLLPIGRSLAQSAGTIAIAIAQYHNAKRQLEWQKESYRDTRDYSFKMHELDYARRIQEQVGSYSLNNAWPLRMHPQAIVDGLLAGGDNVPEIPLNLIIAPYARGVQSQLSDMWGELARFMQRQFALNSPNAVVTLEGAYKPGYGANPNTDVLTIYNGLKSVPTLFIAPYSAERDAKMGVTFAMWGMDFSGADNQRPIVQSVEWDVNGICRGILRDEVAEYRRLISEGKLKSGCDVRIDENAKIFDQEKEALSKGATESEISRFGGIYNKLRIGDDTFVTLGNYMLQRMKLYASVISDLYWTLDYNHAPRLPEIMKTEGLALSEDDGMLACYTNALWSGHKCVLPRHMVNLAADFHLLGADHIARRLISADISLLAKDNFAGDMASMTMYERKDELAALLPADAKTLLRDWGCNQHMFGTLELGLLRGENMINSPNCITAAKECFSLGRDERAFELLNIAAQNGDSDAMWMMGACFYLGQGVEKNASLARYWCEKSASQGNRKGEEYLNEMNWIS